MDWYNTVKRFYPKFWSKSMVGDAVKASKITEEEYFKITGEDYTSEDK